MPLLNTALGGYRNGQRIRRIYKGAQAMIPGRVNLHRNPAVAVTTTGWGVLPAGGTFTTTRETTFTGTTNPPPGVVTTWFKSVCTVKPTGSPMNISTDAGGTTSAPVTPGLLYQLSAYAVSSYTGFSQVRIDVTWFNAAGTAVGTDTVAQPTLTTPDAWERRAKALVAPATAAFVRANIAISGPQNIPVGGYIGVTDVMVEQVATLGSYRDAASPGWGWDAAANASTSSGWN